MTKEKVTELTQNSFNEFLKKEKIAVIDFYAEWCMPCVMMAPILENVAESIKNAKFGKINVDDATDLANKFQISSIPCLIVFKDGKEASRIIGSMNEERLKEKIQESLA